MPRCVDKTSMNIVTFHTHCVMSVPAVQGMLRSVKKWLSLLKNPSEDNDKEENVEAIQRGTSSGGGGALVQGWGLQCWVGLQCEGGAVPSGVHISPG